MKTNWFEMWFEDKQGIISTMIRNLSADIDAGYNPNGNSIRTQIADLEAYQKAVDEQIDAFKEMEETKVQRWCYYDMKKRGVIL